MQPYSLKLTIDGLYGAFAEKYSLTLTHAHQVHTLLLTLGARAKAGPITLLAPEPDERRALPHLLLPRFMKYYTKIKHIQPQRRFFLGVSHDPTPPDDPDTLPHQRDGHDEYGPYTLHAFGTRATLTRPDSDETLSLTRLDPPAHPDGDNTLHCHFGAFSDLFADPMEGLVTICEEAMAKDTEIIVSPLPPQP